MTSFGSSFTLADFHSLLQRCSIHSIPSLYHSHRPLFLHRDDVLVKTVIALSWERGRVLLSAAYHTQSLSVQVYRALLARMVRHNRYVLQLRRGIQYGLSSPSSSSTIFLSLPEEKATTLQLVPWQEALAVYSEAMSTHGIHCPTRMTESVLRLLAPQGKSCWQAALSVLELEQANGRLTKSMVLETARVCTGGQKWETALALLHHVHKEDPTYLSAAISVLRPPGTSLLTLEEAAHATFLPSHGSDGRSESPTAAQRHRLGILVDVVGGVPFEVSRRLSVCQSLISHLIASTTLPAELKARWLTIALAPLPWSATVHLLNKYMGDNDWATTSCLEPRPSVRLTEGAEKQRKRKKRAERKGKRGASGGKEQGDKGTDEKEGSTNEVLGSQGKDVDSSASFRLPVKLFYTLQDAPCTLSVLIAVLLEKCPSAEAAVACVQEMRGLCAHQDSLSESSGDYGGKIGKNENSALQLGHSSTKVAGLCKINPEEGLDDGNFVLDGSGSTTDRQGWFQMERRNFDKLSYALQQPVVRETLLKRCLMPSSCTEGRSNEENSQKFRNKFNGWKTAVPLLLRESFLPSPPALLSQLVYQLRAAKQVELLVRLLQQHIIPSRSYLEPWAMTMIMEAVLAYNQLVSKGDHSRAAEQSKKTSSLSLPLPRVQWLTALSVLLDRQVPLIESCIKPAFPGSSSMLEGITETLSPAPLTSFSSSFKGYSPSITSSASVLSKPIKKTSDTIISPAQLRLAVAICVDSGSCLGALRMIGYARRVSNKLNLPLSKELTALVYCMQYGRPQEAAAVLRQAEEKYGKKEVAPLRQIVSLYPPWKILKR